MTPRLRGIPFTAPNAQAVHEGRKTMTRRVCKPQPRTVGDMFSSRQHRTLMVRDPRAESWEPVKSPYGSAGDYLWVREPWRTLAAWDHLPPREVACDAIIQYEGGPDAMSPTRWGRYRHARFMCRWMARTWLRIEGVRVERVQEISEEDAVAEGCDAGHNYGDGSARAGFAVLWTDIHGPGAWERNDFVWAYRFVRVEPAEVHDRTGVEVAA